MTAKAPPDINTLLSNETKGVKRPLAFVLAGHNGSGKSTLWYERLANGLRIPLVNADRLTMSILPEPKGDPLVLPAWAHELRDNNEVWQSLSQSGVRLFRQLIMEQKQAFAFETVFSHWVEHPDGTFESKVDDIRNMQDSGYMVVLIFVGLSNEMLSFFRVQSRKRGGGHGVPKSKLLARFPRTQKAIGQAAKVADLTLMVDNSLDLKRAFQFVRAQRKGKVLFDARDTQYAIPHEVRLASSLWLDKVVGPHGATARPIINKPPGAPKTP